MSPARKRRRTAPPRPRNPARRHATWVVVIIVTIAAGMVASRVGSCRGAPAPTGAAPAAPLPAGSAVPTAAPAPVETAAVSPVATPFVPLADRMNVDFSGGEPVVGADEDEAAVMAALLKEMAEAAGEVTFGPAPRP
jgi:hypothetical protein